MFINRLFGNSNLPQLPPAAPPPPAEASSVTDLSMQLTERPSPEARSKTVRIQGLKLGTQEHTFEFTLRFKNEQAPVEQKTLQELALGAKRGVERVYLMKVAQLRSLGSKIRDNTATREDRKNYHQVYEEISALDHITHFRFKTEHNKPLLEISCKDPQTDAVKKVEIKIDPEFDGVMKALELTIERKETQLNKLRERVQTNSAAMTTAIPAILDLLTSRNEELEIKIANIEKEIEALRHAGNAQIVIEKEKKRNSDKWLFIPKAEIEIEGEKKMIPLIHPKLVVHYNGKVASFGQFYSDLNDTVSQILNNPHEECKAFAERVK